MPPKQIIGFKLVTSVQDFKNSILELIRLKHVVGFCLVDICKDESRR
jgi:hypothetical protein